MSDLCALLARSARSHADRTAVRQGSSVLTYGELDDLTARFAALLRTRGVRAGDRVAMVLPNVVHFPVVYYGILRAGAVVVPMNPLLKSDEMAFVLQDCAVRFVVAAPAASGEAVPAAATAGAECLVADPVALDAQLLLAVPMTGAAVNADDDTAVILYTSGTTGTPKGAELTHRNLVSNALTAARTLLCVGPDDVLFGGLPLFHAFGQTCAMNTAVAAGACLTLLPRFDAAAALEILRRDEATVFLGVPTMYTALLQTGIGPALPRLRLAVSGGASLPVELLHAAERDLGVTVLEGYGLSETSPVACFNPPDRPRKPGSIGLPVRGVELRLVGDDGRVVGPGAVGELAIRGENVMKGYWNRRDATAGAFQEGWFHSGDLARVDEDGYYFIVDRKKDLVIRGGYNVYPREIEEVLYRHPDVAEAAVIGVPDPARGEEVAAVVVLRPGAGTTTDELRDYVRQRVAAYKYPRIVRFVDALPKGATGKILKRNIVLAPPAPSGA
ncbi:MULTISPECIES: long-chain-fatty-acid--CoA ligase [unclassified Streptomyces]|uniref:long-chain-fatty-acid--CoA ligase n=1 Tax=unclassified Streptomyces TaxID=2593676 RepID=UPI002DDA8EEF|nr:long-chain fatty acid--CoA ligase [Streptomyces sp. NBC_01445]WSE03076.1 long-chain fatty acid--CoA ligase [Streptomyces sp. NBC_01445]